MMRVGAGPLTFLGLSSTYPGSCPDTSDYPKTLSESKSTWSFIT